jgi:hypothetical protein
VKGFVKMKSKWFLISVLALAVLCIEGPCREIQQETAISDLDSAIGSTSPAAMASPAIVAGSWSLILIDSATGRTRSLDVEISQIDEVIFGRGSTGDGDGSELPVQTGPRPTRDEGIESMIWWLRQDPEPMGQTTSDRYLTIGASGLVSGTSLILDLVFLEENVLYRLNLNFAGGSISGSYLAYDSLGRVQSGSCYGYVRAGYGPTFGSDPEVITLGGMRSR